jgi:hypothetical protein
MDVADLDPAVDSPAHGFIISQSASLAEGLRLS